MIAQRSGSIVNLGSMSGLIVNRPQTTASYIGLDPTVVSPAAKLDEREVGLAWSSPEPFETATRDG